MPSVHDMSRQDKTSQDKVRMTPVPASQADEVSDSVGPHPNQTMSGTYLTAVLMKVATVEQNENHAAA